MTANVTIEAGSWMRGPARAFLPDRSHPHAIPVSSSCLPVVASLLVCFGSYEPGAVPPAGFGETTLVPAFPATIPVMSASEPIAERLPVFAAKRDAASTLGPWTRPRTHNRPVPPV